MNTFENVILTDYDGVCAYWEHGFHMWMLSKGYKSSFREGFYAVHDKYGISVDEAEHLVTVFNNSAAIKHLPPLKDAIKYIRKLHEEHGYVFHCITAIPNTPFMHEARMENIHNLFGKTAFERLVLTNHSADKVAVLKEYEGTECYWVEDVMKNAKMGLQFGLRPIIMDRHYNREENHTSIKRLYSWKDIYELITY